MKFKKGDRVKIRGFNEFGRILEFDSHGTAFIETNYGRGWANPEILELIESGGCDHTYKQYIGFRESYEYCLKCDHKKPGAA